MSKHILARTQLVSQKSRMSMYHCIYNYLIYVLNEVKVVKSEVFTIVSICCIACAGNVCPPIKSLMLSSL